MKLVMVLIVLAVFTMGVVNAEVPPQGRWSPLSLEEVVEGLMSEVGDLRTRMRVVELTGTSFARDPQARVRAIENKISRVCEVIRKAEYGSSLIQELYGPFKNALGC